MLLLLEVGDQSYEAGFLFFFFKLKVGILDSDVCFGIATMLTQAKAAFPHRIRGPRLFLFDSTVWTMTERDEARGQTEKRKRE